jgi:hypothetical protein
VCLQSHLYHIERCFHNYCIMGFKLSGAASEGILTSSITVVVRSLNAARGESKSLGILGYFQRRTCKWMSNIL